MGDSDSVEPAIDLESDGDSDSGAYFLEPTLCTSSIADRIAEANRQLFDDITPRSEFPEPDVEPETETKPVRVKFCEDLEDYAPDQPGYSTEDAESVTNVSEEEEISSFGCISDIPNNSEEYSQQSVEDIVNTDISCHIGEESGVESAEGKISQSEEEVEEEEEIDEEADEKHENKEDGEEGTNDEPSSNSSKLLLILLPREQTSSCESIIGEDVSAENTDTDFKIQVAEKDKFESRTRPKSAHNKVKAAKKGEKVQCKLSPVSPELNLECDVESDKRSWHESQALRNKVKIGVKVKVKRETNEKSDLCDANREKILPVVRPKTAPSKRPCCVIRSDLPKYNGLRSEYGLSAEQLQERKLKSAEIRQRRRSEKQSKYHQELIKRQENETKFGVWLDEKTNLAKGSSNSSSQSNIVRKKDTLVRSDAFIQNNAVYASKCGVSYAVNYTLSKSKNRLTDIRRKTINLGKLFESISPHAQRTYQIFVKSNS